jgi:CRP-like cAMP-binding protein
VNPDLEHLAILAKPRAGSLMYVKRSSRFEAHSRRHRKDFVAAPIATENGHRIESIVVGVPLFRGLGRQNVVALAGAARLANARRGASLARRGEPMPGVIAVAEGMLKLALRGSSGAERVLRFVGPGETFGEAAVLLSRPSAVDAVALADTLFVVLPAASIRGLMGRHAPFARLMAMLLAERMLALLTEVEASELRPAGERLAAYLLGLAEPDGEDGRLTAHLPATKTVIASRLGMKKETLSRLLHDLSSRHLIEVSRREIAILDRRGLGEIARS